MADTQSIPRNPIPRAYRRFMEYWNETIMVPIGKGSFDFKWKYKFGFAVKPSDHPTIHYPLWYRSSPVFRLYKMLSWVVRLWQRIKSLFKKKR